MTAAFTLAALVYWDVVHIWHVLALSVITGLAQAFGGPAYQSLLPSLVGKNDVPNAIAFNSIQFNLARVIGPLLAGAALAAFGMVACFGLNGLSFLAVIVAILSLHIRHMPPATTTRMHHELKSGFAYVARASGAASAWPSSASPRRFSATRCSRSCRSSRRTSFSGDVTQYTHLMVVCRRRRRHRRARRRLARQVPHMGRTLLILQVVFGVLIVLFALTRIFWINAVLLFGCGACMVMVFAMLSSLVQLNAPNEMRGRVMSIYMVAFRGGMPLGSLVGGWVATLAGAPTVLIVNGVLLSLVAAWFLVRSHGVREI